MLALLDHTANNQDTHDWRFLFFSVNAGGSLYVPELETVLWRSSEEVTLRSLDNSQSQVLTTPDFA